MIEFFSDIIQCVVAIIALVFAIVQVVQSQRHKRAEFIINLYDEFIKDEDMMEMFYKIEYDEFVYDANFHQSPEEKKLDKLLGHFDNICSLYKMGILSDDDMRFVKYNISRVVTNDNVQKYFCFLDSWYMSLGVEYIKCNNLRQYAQTIKSSNGRI